MAILIIINGVPFHDLTRAEEFADWLEACGIKARAVLPKRQYQRPPSRVQLQDRGGLRVESRKPPEQFLPSEGKR
jgi:hypothetical protein